VSERAHCLLLVLAACHSPPTEIAPSAPPPAASAAPEPAPPPREPPPNVSTDWCVEGLAALDEETCYVLPDGARTLLVYLHGIVPPTPASEQKERVELAVLHTAKRAGAAALVPRGVRGIGPGAARDWWAWPTEPGAHAKHAASLVAKWADARRRLERLAGAPFARTYLAGSSNGAYFLTALALRGDLDRMGFAVDGFGAMSGGSPGGRTASTLTAPRRPFYVGYGAYDDSTKPSARALAALLVRAEWPTRAAEHPVGHGAREEYLDEAFAFWAEQVTPSAGR
jgi:predicted esterase